MCSGRRPSGCGAGLGDHAAHDASPRRGTDAETGERSCRRWQPTRRRPGVGATDRTPERSRMPPSSCSSIEPPWATSALADRSRSRSSQSLIGRGGRQRIDDARARRAASDSGRWSRGTPAPTPSAAFCAATSKRIESSLVCKARRSPKRPRAMRAAVAGGRQRTHRHDERPAAAMRGSLGEKIEALDVEPGISIHETS